MELNYLCAVEERREGHRQEVCECSFSSASRQVTVAWL